MATPRNSLAALSAVLVLLGSSGATAQAVTVISNSSSARACYTAATQAALKMLTSLDDLDTCSRAIDHEALTRNDRAATHINRGIIEVALERYQDALKDYNTALGIVPRLPEAFISRGNLWYMADQFKRAVDDYTEAMNTDFKRPQIPYYNRALARERLDDKAGAETDLREALRIDPEFRQARERLDKLIARSPN